jgi:hypothetical protein
MPGPTVPRSAQGGRRDGRPGEDQRVARPRTPGVVLLYPVETADTPDGSLFSPCVRGIVNGTDSARQCGRSGRASARRRVSVSQARLHPSFRGSSSWPRHPDRLANSGEHGGGQRAIFFSLPYTSMWSGIETPSSDAFRNALPIIVSTSVGRPCSKSSCIEVLVS